MITNKLTSGGKGSPASAGLVHGTRVSLPVLKLLFHARLQPHDRQLLEQDLGVRLGHLVRFLAPSGALYEQTLHVHTCVMYGLNIITTKCLEHLM